MLKGDLECLTGKLLNGDITPIVYDLLKDSPYKEDLRAILSLERSRADVAKQKARTTPEQEAHRRPSLKEWLAEHGQPVTL